MCLVKHGSGNENDSSVDRAFAMEIEVLIIEVDQRRFGIRSTDVVEVLRAVALSKLPNSSAIIEGVFNMRGNIVGVLNLRRMLDLPTKSMRHTDHLIVVQADNRVLALRADRAVELLPLKLDHDEAADKSDQDSLRTTMVGKTLDGIVHVLTPSRFLTDEATKAAIDALANSVATEVLT